MDGPTKAIVVLFVSWLVTVPVSCLAHEFGHAYAVWRCTGQRPTVFVGRRKPGLHLHLRLPFCELWLHPLVDEAWCGYAREGVTVGNERSIALAGPLATIALGICFAIPAYVVGDLSSVLFWIPALGLLMCAIGSMGELMPSPTGSAAATSPTGWGTAAWTAMAGR